MPRIEKTSLAETDVVDIWVYIAQDDRDAATKMLRRIEERLDSIAAMPLSAEAVPSLGCEMRRFSVGNYVVYYQPIEDGIRVIRVLHGAREPGQLL